MIQRLVDRNCQLEFNALLHWQPVKLPQDGRDVLMTLSTKMCCSVLYGMNTQEQIVRGAEQQRVTVCELQGSEC